MLKRLLHISVGLAFAVSLIFNILAFSGAINGRSLMREKDEMTERFAARIKALEEKNKSLEEAQRFLEMKLSRFASASAEAGAELSRILDAYNRMKGGGK